MLALAGSNREFQVGRIALMSENLSLVAWIGPTRHPSRSLLRALLVLVDLQDLRSYALETLQTSTMESTTRARIPYLFSREDEKCFFTYAQYVEPMTSIAVKIYDLQNAISTRTHLGHSTNVLAALV